MLEHPCGLGEAKMKEILQKIFVKVCLPFVCDENRCLILLSVHGLIDEAVYGYWLCTRQEMQVAPGGKVSGRKSST